LILKLSKIHVRLVTAAQYSHALAIRGYTDLSYIAVITSNSDRRTRWTSGASVELDELAGTLADDALRPVAADLVALARAGDPAKIPGLLKRG